MDKLAKFYPNITGASVILDHEVEHQRHCEISVNITGSVVVASADEENMGKAVDVALERVKTHLSLRQGFAVGPPLSGRGPEHKHCRKRYPPPWPCHGGLYQSL